MSPDTGLAVTAIRYADGSRTLIGADGTPDLYVPPTVVFPYETTNDIQRELRAFRHGYQTGRRESRPTIVTASVIALLVGAAGALALINHLRL